MFLLQNASFISPYENIGSFSPQMEPPSFWPVSPIVPLVTSPISSLGSPSNDMSPRTLQFMSPVPDGSMCHNVAMSSPVSPTIPPPQYYANIDMSPPDVSAYCSAAGSENVSPDIIVKLESALQEVCHQNAIPFALFNESEMTSGVSDMVPVSVRVGVLQMHFMMQSAKSKTRVAELQQFYRLQAAQLESERYATLCYAQTTPDLVPNMNSYYDRQHHELIDRIEKSLHLMDSTETTKVASGGIIRKRKAESQTIDGASHHAPSVSPPSVAVPTFTRTSPVLNSVAVRIMTNWYERNSEHPYPSYDAAEIIAKAGDISVEQVKKWFANRRMRGRNTKTLTQIAQRRQKTKPRVG